MGKTYKIHYGGMVEIQDIEICLDKQIENKHIEIYNEYHEEKNYKSSFCSEALLVF